MRPIFRFFILLETVVCFGPITLLLGMSIILIPMAILEALKGNFILLPSIVLVFFGFMGLFAVISLILHMFEPNKIFLSRKKLFIFTGAGITALITAIPITSISGYGYFIVLMPLLATAHFFYLSRAVWQLAANKRIKSLASSLGR